MKIKSVEGRAKFGKYETWYRVSGDLKSKKPPIFILHGGPGAGHNYVDSYKLLSLDGRAVIHYDQVGCGNSTLLPDKGADFWTVQLFIDELNNLVDHLGQRKAFHVLGQSWGGMLGAEYGTTRPAGPEIPDHCKFSGLYGFVDERSGPHAQAHAAEYPGCAEPA